MKFNYLLILFSFLLITKTSHTQNVSVIHEYSDSKVAADMAISKEGNIFICGRYSGFAMLIKLDSNGNEQWINYYDEDYLFSKMLVDSNENIYLHMNASNQFNNNFLLKLDSTGNELWRSDSVIGIYTSGSIKDINLFPYQNRIYLTHNAREEQLDDDDLGISSFHIQTGELLSQTQIEQADNIYPYRMNEVPLKDSKWVLFGYDGVLELTPDGNYSISTIPNDTVTDIPGGATIDGYITYSSELESFVDNFQKRRSYIYWYDNNWNVIQNQPITPQNFTLNDTSSFPVIAMSLIKDKGILFAAQPDIKSDSNLFGNAYLGQMNPDNGIVVWDTILQENPTGTFSIINSNEKLSIAIQGLYTGGSGIRVYKVNLPKINYNTQFITSTEDVVEHTKSNTTIYPNPSNAQFTLQSDLEIETISIYSIDGKLVKMIDIHSTNYSIAIDEAGVYFVNITYSNEKQETLKIIKQ